MLLLLLSACGTPTSPDWLGTRACELMPGLVIDAAGRAYAADAIDPAELALWADGSVSPGIRAIGVPGYGVIRANLMCTLEGVIRDEDGTQVRLTRSEPDVSTMDPFVALDVHTLDRIERSIEVDIVQTELGPRARVGLAQARAEAAAAHQLARSGDQDGAMAAFDALHDWFPDPMITWEKRAVADAIRQTFEQTQLQLEVSEDMLWVVHAGEWAIGPGLVSLDCGGVTVERSRPEMKPGDRVAMLLEDELRPDGCVLAAPNE